MRVLISNDGTHAHYYQRMAWANAFHACGIQTAFWDCKNVPAFDVFDSFEPDMFLGQSYNLTDDVIKCIYERPHLKVGLRAGDWGDHELFVDKNRFNILYCSPKEIKALEKLKQETGKPDFVHIHYNENAIKETHNKFEEIGIKPVSLMMCADMMTYEDSKYDEELSCDIGFVGGFWPYKGQIISRYLFPLLDPIGKYRVKIFGNQPWQVNQYCGVITDSRVKDLFASSKICPNLSEPHAQEFGFDINERIFKVLCAGGFCISDNVEGYKMFGDGVVIADSPKDFQDKVDYYLKNEDERIAIAKKGQEFVIENHTGFHRVAQILNEFGHSEISMDLLKQYKEAVHA
jgi:glycosyltransferase involved in cell wall biosynthesis